MNWELQRAEEAASPQPGGTAMDEFIRQCDDGETGGHGVLGPQKLYLAV